MDAYAIKVPGGSAPLDDEELEMIELINAFVRDDKLRWIAWASWATAHRQASGRS